MSYAAKLTKCEAEVARLTAELAAMRERCERLFELAQREHRECEDRWYSCPKSDDGCADERNTGCTCGADSHNAKVRAITNDLTPLKETSDGQ